MARKRSQGAFEYWVDLVALLPWWVGVALAIVSYLWLHSVATAPMQQYQAVPGQMAYR